eukprot:bmy_20740T0
MALSQETYDSLCLVDTSLKCVIKESAPKENSHTGEMLQTVLLERHESCETEDYGYREIQRNMRDFEYQWRSDERNYRGVPVTHKKHLTGRRDQHGRRDEGNKPIENRLGLSFQSHLAELQIFPTEGQFYEYHQVEKSNNSGSSFSIHPSRHRCKHVGQRDQEKQRQRATQRNRKLRRKEGGRTDGNVEDCVRERAPDSGEGSENSEKKPKGWESIKSVDPDISPTHVIKKLQPKENTNSTDIFQTVILGRHESHEVKDFYLREIRENMHHFECQWRGDERNYKGMPVTHNENLTDRKDQHGRSDAGNKPIENKLALSFQDELQIFQTERKIYEYEDEHCQNGKDQGRVEMAHYLQCIKPFMMVSAKKSECSWVQTSRHIKPPPRLQFPDQRGSNGATQDPQAFLNPDRIKRRNVQRPPRPALPSHGPGAGLGPTPRPSPWRSAQAPPLPVALCSGPAPSRLWRPYSTVAQFAADPEAENAELRSRWAV